MGYIALFEESVVDLDVEIDVTGLHNNLERSRHFHDATIGFIVTIPDTEDDSLNLWMLNDIKQLKINGYLQRITASEIFFLHESS